MATRRRKKGSVAPLTPDTWDDFVRLFGSRGACGGCWCQVPRSTRAEFEANKGDGNRERMRELVESGSRPGILLYDGDEAIGWCSIEPREKISSLARSRIFKPVDDLPVWSIVCLFVAKEARGIGTSVRLIEGSVDYAAKQGATVVEAYPTEPTMDPMPPPFAYMGFASAYLAAGFTEVARRSRTRPIMRRHCDG